MAGTSESAQTKELTSIGPGDARRNNGRRKAFGRPVNEQALQNLKNEKKPEEKTKKQRRVLAGKDAVKQSAREQFVGQHGPVAAGPGLNSNLLEEGLRVQPQNAVVSRFHLISQNLAPRHASIGGNTSVDPEPHLSKSFKRLNLSKNQTSDKSSRKVLEENEHFQQASIHQPPTLADQRPAPLGLDFLSFQSLPLNKSSFLPDEQQPLSVTSSGNPHDTEDLASNHHPTSTWYRNHLRKSVDPTFTNDNWGDEYYFPATTPTPFKYIEDFQPNPSYHSRDHDAITQGLNLQAAKIPERTAYEAWQSYSATIHKASLENSYEDPPPPSLEELRRFVHGQIAAAGRQHVVRDLRPKVQREKILASERAGRGLDGGAMAGPDEKPFRGVSAALVGGGPSYEERELGDGLPVWACEEELGGIV